MEEVFRGEWHRRENQAADFLCAHSSSARSALESLFLLSFFVHCKEQEIQAQLLMATTNQKNTVSD